MKSVNTPVNILTSFAYSGKSEKLAESVSRLHQEGSANVMIDSGAFSAFNNKGFDHVNIDNYCRFLDKYGDCSEKYIMLDVIGNDAASKKNYETMLSRGYNPMFVVTMFDKDFEYIGQAVKNNRHLCVAGGATVKNDWLVQRFQRVYKSTCSMARIHGLAYVTFPKMMQINLESVDSSSWAQGAMKYGISYFFTPTGMHGYARTEVLERIRKRDRRVIGTLDAMRLTPKDVVRPENYRGNDSICMYLAVRAHMEMQRYAYRRGLRYFLAVSNNQQLRCVEYMIENWDNCEWSDFRKYVRTRK